MECGFLDFYRKTGFKSLKAVENNWKKKSLSSLSSVSYLLITLAILNNYKKLSYTMLCSYFLMLSDLDSIKKSYWEWCPTRRFFCWKSGSQVFSVVDLLASHCCDWVWILPRILDSAIWGRRMLVVLLRCPLMPEIIHGGAPEVLLNQ